MKIGYLAAILKRYKNFIFLSWNMVVISVYIYGVKIIKKFRWESGFLGGSMEPPLCTNRSVGYLMQLGVNDSIFFFFFFIYSFIYCFFFFVFLFFLLLFACLAPQLFFWDRVRFVCFFFFACFCFLFCLDQQYNLHDPMTLLFFIKPPISHPPVGVYCVEIYWSPKQKTLKYFRPKKNVCFQ